MHQLHLLVEGRVQGVGFRRFVARLASEHGVNGTVRNLADGTVEVNAEAERSALEGFRADVLAGNLSARVELVQERWSEGTARHHDFRITA
ncbi:MAG: acylphosphatase [Candidatus Eisenbacteria bacterium]|nr:acylphosphatase [Candidatus Eisenbacteria bacterium]